MPKQTLTIVIVVAVIAVGTSFFVGMKYAGSQSGAVNMQNFQNLSPAERQQRLQQLGGSARGGRGIGGMGGGTFGEILSKDDKSLTIKLRTGGSKIIFFDQKVEIGKFVAGNLSDLTVGASVSINGTANADSSITASSIQIRPTSTPTGIPMINSSTQK
jgi:hypothetical protein